MLENTRPIYSALYWPILKAREFERQETCKMLLQQVEDPAQSRLVAPVVVVAKKNGSIPTSVDYWRLKAFRTQFSYQTPCTDVFLDSI